MNEALKAKLSEYDSIILIDRSGSMGDPAKGFSSRWVQAEEITKGLASLASQVDEDGITVITFGGTFNPSNDVVDGVKADAVTAIFAGRGPGGGTPTADALQAAFDKKFASGKKAVVICVTDGTPNDKGAVEKAIKDAAGKLDDASGIRVLFLQVGDDASAASWLGELDNLSGAKFDIVNTISHKDADGLSPEALFDRALNDTH